MAFQLIWASVIHCTWHQSIVVWLCQDISGEKSLTHLGSRPSCRRSEPWADRLMLSAGLARVWRVFIRRELKPHSYLQSNDPTHLMSDPFIAKLHTSTSHLGYFKPQHLFALWVRDKTCCCTESQVIHFHESTWVQQANYFSGCIIWSRFIFLPHHLFTNLSNLHPFLKTKEGLWRVKVLWSQEVRQRHSHMGVFK